MRRFLYLLFLLVFPVLMHAQVENYIPPVPNPPRLVNDGAGLLTQEQRDNLEAKLDRYDDSTTNQILIVTVTDLHGYDASEYAVALGRKWDVGNKQNKNGIVILVSTGGESGNRDAFIAVGQGLQGAVPDLTAGQVLDNELIPGLKSGDYFHAFDDATSALIKAAAGEYKAPAGYADRNRTGNGNGRGGGRSIIGIIIFIIILLSFFRGGGGGNGGYTSRRGYRDIWLGSILGSLGSGGWGSSGGSGWGGGSSGGGGGFGGFGGGGGGFDGGGAGGKW